MTYGISQKGGLGSGVDAANWLGGLSAGTVRTAVLRVRPILSQVGTVRVPGWFTHDEVETVRAFRELFELPHQRNRERAVAVAGLVQRWDCRRGPLWVVFHPGGLIGTARRFPLREMFGQVSWAVPLHPFCGRPR